MKIGFVGLGKLGFDAAVALAEKHEVKGYDINRTMKTSNFEEVNTLEKACKDRDIVFVAVQTPHDPIYGGEEPTSHLEPKDFDYTFITKAVADIDELIDPGTMIAVISTMLPGTVRSQIAPLVKNGKFIYNPYLIAQGTVIDDMKNPEMIMIGTENGKIDENVEKLFEVYDPILKDVYNTRYEVGTWEETEATKVFYNTFISAKLTLVNMIQDVAMKVGHMNVDQVANSLAKSYHRITSSRYMKPGFDIFSRGTQDFFLINPEISNRVFELYKGAGLKYLIENTGEEESKLIDNYSNRIQNKWTEDLSWVDLDYNEFWIQNRKYIQNDNYIKFNLYQRLELWGNSVKEQLSYQQESVKKDIKALDSVIQLMENERYLFYWKID